MLAELHVRDLGVIDDLTLVLGPGMTALTGETGAGKTLLVEAIELLLGERADPALVRSGATEARVEGRFLVGAEALDGEAGGPGLGDRDLDGEATGDRTTELVLARVVQSEGRSRAYSDGRLATAAELVATGGRLVDLHGQHEHQSLLRPGAQRAALDRFGGIDTGPRAELLARLAATDSALTALGGDARARQREVDLLRFELAELDGAEITGTDEGERLEAEEEALASASAARLAGETAVAVLSGDDGAFDVVARANAALAQAAVYEEMGTRLRSIAVDVEEAAADLRRLVEGIVEDPERLEAVRARRRQLADLCRKYASSPGGAHPTALAEVVARRAETIARLAELEHHGERVAQLEVQREALTAEVEVESARLGSARRAAAPDLAAAVEAHLRRLALPGARFEISFAADDPSGESVTFLLGANAGQPAMLLAKVASGGELSRIMLAARLVLNGAPDSRLASSSPALRGPAGPPTLVFDEVDSGVGGEAALAVGRALAELAEHHQVLVVTHLPQVAAFADAQVAVAKAERDGRTVASARVLDGEERVVELSRMLSGQPQSATARDHAEELLATASRRRDDR